MPPLRENPNRRLRLKSGHATGEGSLSLKVALYLTSFTSSSEIDLRNLCNLRILTFSRRSAVDRTHLTLSYRFVSPCTLRTSFASICCLSRRRLGGGGFIRGCFSAFLSYSCQFAYIRGWILVRGLRQLFSAGLDLANGFISGLVVA